MDLSELKAQNAKQEEAETVVSPQEITAEAEPEAVEVEAVESEQVAEPASDTTEETETEAWMQGDDQSSSVDEKEKKYTGSDIGAAKAKVRAKAEKKLVAKDDEIEQLKAQLEAAKQSKPVTVGAKPRRDQFYESEDQDEAFMDALTDWKIEQAGAKQQAQTAQVQTQQQQQERQTATNTAVDQHYERAAELIEKSGIAADVYQSADLKVRQMMESVYPGAGDSVTDMLISQVGEGSDKVFFNLGVNQAKLSQLESLLRADPNGMKAAVFLGKLSTELSAPQKRTTNAPAPATQLNGDKSGGSHGAAERKYNDALGSNNVSKAWDIKKAAKAAGANTQAW